MRRKLFTNVGPGSIGPGSVSDPGQSSGSGDDSSQNPLQTITESLTGGGGGSHHGNTPSDGPTPPNAGDLVTGVTDILEGVVGGLTGGQSPQPQP